MRLSRFILVAMLATSVHAVIPATERAALIALYDAAGGENWSDNSGWLGSNGTECDWFGISCDEDGSTVIAIHLGDNNLAGTLPDEIGDLANQVILSLHDNQLSGPIPSVIGMLSSLEELTLNDNLLSGSIPPSLGNLTVLRVLDIGANRLTGPVPKELGQLANLEELWLGGFGYDDSMPDLEGSIPPELGNLANLKILDLFGHRLTGAIPKELGGLTNLNRLDLGRNRLGGSIPPELGELTRLSILNLGGNLLSGSIPAELGNLSALRQLMLCGDLEDSSSPRLSGSIPAEIGELTRLEELDLSFNSLVGDIPQELWSLEKLRDLKLNSNGALTGTIPISIGAMTDLETLELSQNGLSGPLPPELGNLTGLQWIGLNENRFTGPIPGTWASLASIEWMSLFGNRLTGEIPVWLGNLTTLTGLLLDENQFTGTLPASLTNLTLLDNFGVEDNYLSGPLPTNIGNWSRMEYFSIAGNDFSGPLPDSFWDLDRLVNARIEGNRLSGSISPRIGDLDDATLFLAGDNDFEGELPPEIGDMGVMEILSFDGNRLSGEIPAEIGNLTTIQFLGLEKNAFAGTIPDEMLNLSELTGLRLGFNAITTDNGELRDFLDARNDQGTVSETQTLPPTGIGASDVTDRSALITWTPIEYALDSGGYEVSISLASNNALVTVATTATKTMASIIVRGLAPGTSYRAVVRSTTHPHGFQKNFLRSSPSDAVAFTTGPRVTGPADVDVVSTPGGLIQIGGVPQNSTSWAVTNFGDVATEVTLSQDSTFFSLDPAQFTLNPGATQVISVESVPGQPSDSYYGVAFIEGDGVREDLFVVVQLLSVDAPSGTMIAEAVTSRVELSGAPGTNSIGSVVFRNIGSATLTGILVSDDVWIETPADDVVIGPGETASVNFTVRRSKRPDAGGGGVGRALRGTIRLVYLEGVGASSFGRIVPFDDPTGVTSTLVTVVDTTKPPVGPSDGIPDILDGEVARFILGVKGGAASSSDVTISNSFGISTLGDLRVFLLGIGGTSLEATLGSLPPDQSLALAGVVGSVFENEGTGNLQVRTDDWDLLGVNATLSSSGFAGSLPVFRSDRGSGAGEEIVLAGVRNDASFETEIFVQEVSGGNAPFRATMFDASGVSIATLEVSSGMGRFGSAHIEGVAEGTASVLISVDEDASGSIVAHALVTDSASGDSWVVADWNRYSGAGRLEAMRVPIVIREGVAPGRRRPVDRPGIGKGAVQLPYPRENAFLQTDMAIFNPGVSDARVRVTFHETSGSKFDEALTIGPKETEYISNATASLRGRDGVTSGYVDVEAISGRIATSSRMWSAASGGGTRGAGVPAVPVGKGLRIGQSQLFAGLEDSSSATVAAHSRGTLRTSFGIAETAGESTTVRATLLLFDGSALAGVVVSKDFVVGANQVRVVADMAKAILGSDRDTLFGDLKNLQLELRVVGGNGAATFFVIEEDNSSGDLVFRLE